MPRPRPRLKSMANTLCRSWIRWKQGLVAEAAGFDEARLTLAKTRGIIMTDKSTLICPRCESTSTGVRFESPVAGVWTLYGCDDCLFTWRSTEPKTITDPKQYPTLQGEAREAQRHSRDAGHRPRIAEWKGSAPIRSASVRKGTSQTNRPRGFYSEQTRTAISVPIAGADHCGRRGLPRHLVTVHVARRYRPPSRR